MKVAYIYVNFSAFLLFALMLIAFFAAARSKEINAWITLLGDLTIWAMGSLFMRLDVFPNYEFWYYVSLLALFMIAFLVYNYVYQFANAKPSAVRLIWLIGSLVILCIASTGVFLAPPEAITDENGITSFVYTSTDWPIAIPLVFFMCIVASIIKLFRSILRDKGTSAPGVKELIIGCFVLALGNVVQILPGNTFPWDTLCGALFAVFMCVSLYKRRMFNTTQIISSGILVLFTGTLFVAAGAYFFPITVDAFVSYGGHITDPAAEAFIFMTALLLIVIAGFKRLLYAMFSEEEQVESRIKQYSDQVSQTLDMDSVLRETIKVIKSELRINQMYICTLDKERYVPVCSAMPLKPAKFSISADHPCIKLFERGENYLILSEFESNPLYKSAWGSERQVMAENDIACICALKDGDAVVGLLLLANKEKNAAYTYSDFSFLNTVCSIASIAIKNAVLFGKVAEREHLFRSMTEFIPTALFIKPRAEDRYDFVSANTERVLGLPRDFFEKTSPSDAVERFLGRDRAEEALKKLRASDPDGYTCDIPFANPNECREMTIRVAMLPIVSDGTVSHYACAVNDITADIETQELLKNSMELAQSSSKAKGEFLSHMSHEIRTPMNSIAGLTYLAREQAARFGDTELTDCLDQIEQSSQYLLSLLNNIMDMSKIENSKYEVHTEPFDLVKVLDEVSAVYSAQMQAKSVKLELAENIKYRNVLGDEISLRKILNNLLSNALKFTPTGGSVTLTVSERVSSEKSVIVHITVSDTGCGMSEEFIGRLFEPYSQEISKNGKKAAGSGLGMAICKSMVELQGGSIAAESKLGEGSRFDVELPYSLSVGIESEPKTELDYSVLDGKRIMVVDDVMINTMITKRLLEKHGCKVECAENGREACELFTSRNDFYFDCILMDIQMPVMDGIEAASEIRASGLRYAPLVPIIAMTADVFAGGANPAAHNDFNDQIIKPVSPDELYEKLIKHFSKED